MVYMSLLEFHGYTGNRKERDTGFDKVALLHLEERTESSLFFVPFSRKVT